VFDLEPRAQDARAALTEVDGLLALADSGTRLDAEDCLRLVERTRQAPGRWGRVVRSLSAQRDAAAVDALLRVPAGASGVVEGVFQALRAGVVRPGASAMVALEFRSSKSRRFPALLARAHASFGDQLERLRIDGALYYRLALFVPERRRVAALELDLERIHRDLQRLRGVSLWLNGWRFDDRSSLRPAARGPLLRAWLDWALEPPRGPS